MTAPTSTQLAAALSQVNAQLARMQQRIAMLESNARAAQLGSSSIDSGTLTATDGGGNPVLQFGLHDDGTYAMSAPGSSITPLTPSDPQVAPGVLSLVVTWDGGTASGAPPLADLAGVQVHASTDSSYTPSDDTFQGMMPPAGSGGGFIVAGLQPGTPYYVCLTAVNLAGLASPPTDFMPAVPAAVEDSITAGSVTAGMLAANLVIAGVVDGTTIAGATLQGATLEITQDGPILIYQGVPGPGNLIASWSPVGGTDGFGNPYPLGLNVGVAGPTQITLLPAIGSAFNITTLISGVLEAAAALFTNDVSEQIPGLLGALILGTGAAAKMTTALTSPVGSGQGAAIMLEAQNDGGTDTAMITFGTVTTPDESTEVFSPVMSVSPYALLLYSGASGQTTKTATSGSGTWPIPLGVTTGKGEVWGPAGGTGAGTTGAPLGGRGGSGGGAYSCEPALALTPGGTAAYSVPAPGPAVTGAGTGSTPSGPATITGTSVTVTASPGNGSGAGQAPGTGGAASGNTISFKGGDGGAGGTGSVGAPQVTHSQQWSAVHTYSYEGTAGDSSPDPGYSPGAKMNTDGAVYQGDDQLGDNGNCCGIILWPWPAIQAALSGYASVTSVTISLWCTHTWYNAGMSISMGYSEYGGTFGASRNLDGWAATTAAWYYNNVTPGYMGSYAVPSSAFAAFAGKVSATILYNHASSRTYYGFFAGGGTFSNSPQIAYAWKTGGGVTTEGAGGGGGGGAGPSGPGANGSPGGVSAGGNGGAGAQQAGTGGKGGGYNANGNSGSGTAAGAGGGGYGSGSGAAGVAGLAKLTYAGTPPPILLSIASAAGTDQFGTAYATGARLTLADDHVTYSLGENVMRTTGSQTISSTSNAGITGLSQAVAAGGTYEFEGLIRSKQGAVNVTQQIGFTGPAASFCVWFWNQSNQASTSINQWVVAGSLATVGVGYGAANNENYFEFKGTVTFSAGGTFQGAAAEGTAGDTFVIQPGSFMKVRRVS